MTENTKNPQNSKLALHWKILIALFLGMLLGLCAQWGLLGPTEEPIILCSKFGCYHLFKVT